MFPHVPECTCDLCVTFRMWEICPRELTDEEIEYVLKDAGIDMEPAYKRLREMVERAKLKQDT